MTRLSLSDPTIGRNIGRIYAQYSDLTKVFSRYQMAELTTLSPELMY